MASYKMNKNLILTSAAILWKGNGKKRRWFIAKHTEDSEWELPKMVARRTESSARASLRMLEELGGMTTQVLEEVGKSGGVTRVGNKVVPQRHIYYLLKYLSTEGKTIGFAKTAWLEYAKAVRKLTSKRDQSMLRESRKVLAKWEKEEAIRVKEIKEKERLKALAAQK